MNLRVNFELAKLLKEKGFDEECEYFYSKYGIFNYLKPHREYEHLHSYSEQLVSYFDGKYDWNSLSVDEGMIALKTSFSETDGFVNCECSAPTIADVVMWLYEKHKIWISVSDAGGFGYMVQFMKTDGDSTIDGLYEFNSPTEAYEAAIFYTLKKLN